MKKYYSLLVLFAVLSVGTVWAQESGHHSDSPSNGRPYYAEGHWWSLYDPTIHEGNNNYDRNPYVYPPTAGEFKFDHKNTTPGVTGSTLGISLDVFACIDRTKLSLSNMANFTAGQYGFLHGWNDYNQSGWKEINHTSKDFFTGDHYNTYTNDISRWISQVSVKKYNGGGYDWKSCNFQIRLATHLRLQKAGVPYGTDRLDTAFAGSTQVHSVAQQSIDVYFRSFLTEETNGNILIEAVSGDVEDFRIGRADNAALTCTYNFGQNACGVYDHQTSDPALDASQQQYAIRFYFRPKSVGSGQNGYKTAVYKITNGTGENSEVYVELHAYATPDPLTFTTDGTVDLTAGPVNTATYQLNIIDYLKNSAHFASNYVVDGLTYSFANGLPAQVASIDAQGNITFYQKADFEFDITAHSDSAARDNTTSSATAHIVLTNVPYGTMTFTGTGLYTTQARWDRPDILPTEHQNVLISGTCALEDMRPCHDLTIGTGELTIRPDGAYTVEGNLENNTAANLVLEAEPAHMGTLRFNEGTHTAATVVNFLKGTYAGGNLNQVDWQYRGAIGAPDPISWTDVNVYEWDETLNGTNCWKNYQNDNISLTPWLGYAWDNHQASQRYVRYTTKLIPVENGHTFSLTHTATGKANEGCNLVTNSYSAPVEIADLTFSNANAELFFFNTSTHDEWKSAGGSDSTLSGQIVAYPLHTGAASGLQSAIPAGQSFSVVATGANATLTIPAKAVVGAASGEMYAPLRDDEFNVLGIRLSADGRLADRVVLIESDNCTDGYDNGYDGTKRLASASVAALYATTAFGRTMINASQSMVGTELGFHAAQAETEYTLSFETDNLEGYSELYLRDNQTGAETDILAGATYRFHGTTGLDNHRFSILGSRIIADVETGLEPENDIRVADNRAFITGHEGETLTIVDMQGRLITTTTAHDRMELDLSSLATGVYVVKAGTQSVKFIR